MFTVKDKESEATRIPINTVFVDVRRFLTQTRLSPIYFEARWLFQIIQGHAPKVMYLGPQKFTRLWIFSDIFTRLRSETVPNSNVLRTKMHVLVAHFSTPLRWNEVLKILPLSVLEDGSMVSSPGVLSLIFFLVAGPAPIIGAIIGRRLWFRKN